MRILLEISLDLLYVSCVLFCCRYLWKKDTSKQFEEQLKDLK
jgi:hypothetical protein